MSKLLDNLAHMKAELHSLQAELNEHPSLDLIQQISTHQKIIQEYSDLERRYDTTKQAIMKRRRGLNG